VIGYRGQSPINSRYRVAEGRRDMPLATGNMSITWGELQFLGRGVDYCGHLACVVGGLLSGIPGTVTN
jgi:hypothetical protein